MNLWDLCRDAFNVLRFRFQAAEQYRYGAVVFLAVALAIGVAHAVVLMPALGQTHAVLAFGVVLGIGRWLLLTRAITAVLHYFGAPRIGFLGYTLATEALILPNIVLFYRPEWAHILMFWNVWIFWAQLAGFQRIGGVTQLRVLLCAYLVYWLAMGAYIAIMFALFTSGGWLDAAAVGESLKQHMEQNRR